MLVSMKRTTKERKAEKEQEYQPPEYGWGLQIRLEQDELQKLGIIELPTVGTTMAFDIEAEVTSVSQNSTTGGEEQRCVCLQITKMGLEEDEDEDAQPVAKQSKPSKPALLGKY